MNRTVGAAAAIAAICLALTGCGEQEKTERGNCGASSYELSVEKDGDQLEVTFELQSEGPGEIWNVLVEQDDESLLEGERQTDEDGELDVDAFADEGDGTSFSVTATPETGDACTASIDF